MLKKIFLFLSLFSIFLSASFSEGNFNLSFITQSDGPFWMDVVKYSKATAEDLGIDLDVYIIKRDRDKFMQTVKDVCNSGTDGIILSAITEDIERTLILTESYNIPVFTINNSKDSFDFLPRTRYQSWIGEMNPADTDTGSTLIQQLLSEANKDGIKDFNVLGISPSGARERIAGFNNVVSNDSRIYNYQIVESTWSRADSKEIFINEYKKDPNINVVWAVSDQVALGVIEAIEELGIQDKIYVGGVNWDLEALESISLNQMDVTLGGHIFIGSWAILNLHDYLNGKDFSNESLSFDIPMFSINSINQSIYTSFLEMEPRQINFLQYSKVYNVNQLHSFNDVSKLVTDHNKVTNEIQFTNGELQWLRDNPVVKVHNELDWAPFNFNKGGIPSGFSIDYMDLIAEAVGLKVEYVSGPSWSEFMSMMQNDELDVMLNIAYTEERDSFLNFTDSYLDFSPSIYTRDNESSINSIEDLFGKTFAIQKDFFYEEIIKPYPQINLLQVTDTKDAIMAVSKGEADVMLDLMPVVNYLMDSYLITNLKPGGSLGLGLDAVLSTHIGVRDNLPLLSSIIQKGMKVVPESKLVDLRRKWLNGTTDKQISLTSDEIEFLSSHGVVKVHNELNWPPFNFNVNGTPTGLSIDYMNLIASKLGITVDYISGPSWSEFIEMMKNRELDIMLNIVDTPDRREFINFAGSYIKNPNVIVSSKSSGFRNLEELKGKKVVLPEGFFYEELIKTEYPEIELIFEDDVLSCLKSVSFGKAEATFTENAVANYLIKDNFLSQLYISGEVSLGHDGVQNLNVGVRKDLPILNSVIEKAIKSITPDEMYKITSKWLDSSDSDDKFIDDLDDSLNINRVLNVVIMILVLFIIVYAILKILRKNNIYTTFINVRQLRIFSLIILAFSIAIIFGVSFLILDNIRSSSLNRLKENLLVILNTTDQNLSSRTESNLTQLELDSNNPKLVNYAKELVSQDWDKESLIASNVQGEIRNYFKNEQRYSYSEGYFIISPDGISLASSRDENLGTKNLIFEKRNNLFEKVLEGHATFIPPILSDVSDIDHNPSSHSSMFYAVPILDENDKVIAVLTQREDPSKDFSRYCSSGRVGTTGETYAFDKSGTLITHSRFEEEFYELGLVDEDDHSSLHILLKDPGFNLANNPDKKINLTNRPFTTSVENGLLGINGVDIKGYRDYRGIEVYGAWLWNNDFDYGLVIEIDSNDALSSYYSTRNLIFILLFIISIIITASTIFSMIMGERANKALFKANDDLENRVETRTKELSDATQNLVNTIEALTHPFYVIDVKNHNIILANSAAKKAARGEEITTCYALTHRRDTPCDSKDHPCPLNQVLKTKEPYIVEHIHLDEFDNERYVEVHGYPIFNDNGEVTQMIEYSMDITDRKQAEAEIEQINFKSDVALELTNSGYWYIDYNDPDYYYQSERAAKILGDPIKDDMRYHLQDEWFVNLEKANKETAEITAERYQGTLDGKYETYDSTYAYKSPISGEITWVHAGGKVIKDDSGKVLFMYGAYQDITEQKKNEEALIISEEQLNYAFEATGEGIWDWNIAEESVSHNNKWIEMLSLDPEYINHDLEFFSKLIHPDDLSFVMSNLEAMLENDTKYGCEYRMVKLTGVEIWVEDRGKVVQRDSTGKPLRVVGSILDITERKRIEQEIIKSDERFKIATESARLATWEWEIAEDSTFGSHMYVELFGFDPQQEKVSEIWGKRLHPEDKDSAFKELTDHLEGKCDIYKTEFRYRHPKDEKYIWLSGIGKIVEWNDDGSPKKMMGINQDITERKEQEQSIELFTNLVFGSLEAANVGAWWVDFNEVDTVYALDTTAKMLGLPLDESGGNRYKLSDWENSLKESALIHTEHADMINANFDSFDGAVSGKYESYRATYPIFDDANEKPRWIDDRANIPTRFKDGTAQLMTGTLIDITDQYESEIKLEKAKELAEEATKAKSDFLANMSHEIRTPMNAIIGLTTLVQKTELSSKQEDYVQKIYGSAHNLLGIINDILDFSKIEAGKLSMENINFDLHEVFDNLGSMITEKALDRGLELIFHIATDVPVKLIGDPLRLGQILLNLTNNAIKFTDSGEIVVLAELEETHDNSVKIKFMVRDSGIGLTEDQSSKLFQAFTQADSSTTRKYGGTGLGLSISKKLVEMMDGEIGVDSIYGEGSTFHFTGDFEVRDYDKLEIIPAELKGLDVLIVDDNATSREVLSEYIKDFKLNPVAVDNGSEAIQLIRKLRDDNKKGFDLVLMDYSMPGLNGFQTAEKINEILVGDERPKYILVTGFGRDDVLVGVDRHSFSGFVLKPVNQSLLFNTIMQSFGQERKDVNKRIKGDYPVGFDNVRGAKILLVEDNEINQQVAKELLEGEGFYVDIANNGKESLDKIKESEYDIVLMDLQMPVMGGYDATKIIRTDENNSSLPIVAMTADAMSGVKDSVIEVGMNDYITKPIETLVLWKTLVKYITPGKRELPESYSIIKKSLEDIIPEIEGIDITTGIERVGGNKKLYKKLIKQFADENREFKNDFNKLIDDGKKEEAIRLIHTIKGVSGNLGANNIQEKAAELESSLKVDEDHIESADLISEMLTDIISNIDSAIFNDTQEIEDNKKMDSEELKQIIIEAADHLLKRKPKPAMDLLEQLDNVSLSDDIEIDIKKAKVLAGKYKMKDSGELLKEVSKRL